ncbi:MAG: hypothetical protein GC156_06595 [Actinomycetales bacterium]|nr:hypothetical protein [Actinomycetales bacterium]
MCTLIRGSAAMLSFCGAFDTEVYDPLLRVSMAAQRDDFSGDMSIDFLRMMKAKHALVSALGEAGLGHAPIRHALSDAEKHWYAQHGEVVLALHPGDSLLKEKIDGLKRHSPDFDYKAYIDSVVRSEQATRDYDSYFGVERTDDISPADYWTQAVAKVDVVHHHFELTEADRQALLRCDALLLTIIAEQLAGA